MRVVTRLLGLAAAGAFIAGAVQAQTCTGYSSLAKGGMNISGSADFRDGGTSYGARLAMGHMGMGHNHAISLFARQNMFDDVTIAGATVSPDATTTFGGALGALFGNDAGWEWCPQIGVDYTTGDTKVLGLSGIIGIGKAMGSMGAISPVPFLWGGVGYAKPDCDGCESNTDAVYGAGLGFRFGGGQQITPSISKTSADGDKAVFHVTVTFPFGHKM